MVQSRSWSHGSKPTEVAAVKRLLIVADNSFAAQSIRLALRQTAGFQVVGFVDGTVPITSRIVELQPELVLIDDTHEPEHALARLEELTTLVPTAKRIFLTMRMDDATVNEIFEAGADALISKSVHPVSLATLLREISRDAVVHRFRTRAKPTTADCPLTDRELEILRLVAQGHTNARIARELWVTEQTVKFHLSNTYRKLGVANRTEASRYAHMHDLMAA
jgi:DNA-binding NarL/FixJ family response regulator